MTQPIHPRVSCGYLYVISSDGYPPPAADTGEHLRRMKDLGFVTVELEGIRSEHLRQMHQRRQQTLAELGELGLSVNYFCVVLPGLGSPLDAQRQENLALFELGCQTAAALGAKGVLDNAPLPPYQFPGDIPVVRHYDEDVLQRAMLPADLDWKAYWRDLSTTYREACDIAARYQLTYLMHPCLGVLSATTDAFLHFADAVGRDNLRFNLDTANQFLMRDNLALSLVRLADRIDYIHVSDNGGQRCEHLPIGAGAIHWPTFWAAVDRIGYRGDFGIDIGGEGSGGAELDRHTQHAAQWVSRHLLGVSA